MFRRGRNEMKECLLNYSEPHLISHSSLQNRRQEIPARPLIPTSHPQSNKAKPPHKPKRKPPPYSYFSFSFQYSHTSGLFLLPTSIFPSPTSNVISQCQMSLRNVQLPFPKSGFPSERQMCLATSNFNGCMRQGQDPILSQRIQRTFKFL